jgi:NADH-quinone oxidoreductase subunit M
MPVPHLLSVLIWLPILGAVAVLAFGRQANTARWLALLTALATFALSIPLWLHYVPALGPAMQFIEHVAWIPALNANYALGVDGISVALIVLTTFTSVLVIIGSWGPIESRVSQYMAAMLALEGLLIGVFAATDALLFYVFFEGMLIPMFILIGIWGGPRRVYATLKFFIYTFLGSIFMLVALIYLHMKTGEFSIAAFAQAGLSAREQAWIFFAFLLGFAIKVPMWPVHTWLPDAHVEAPTGGSVVLAAIMLKLGAYGFLRFSLPITPDASREWAPLIIAISLVAVIYIGFVALVQQDMKKLVAYSSVAHMGFVTLGFFVFNELGVAGGIVQMISHGFVSGAMFLCIGVLYDRLHSRQIADYGGVVNSMPRFAAFAMLFFMANCGLPGTSGFTGEWMVILATVKANFWLGLLAATALITGAAYSLWMYKRVYFGKAVHEAVRKLADIDARETLMLALLVAPVLVMGLYPKPFTDAMQVSVAELLKHVAVSKLN